VINEDKMLNKEFDTALGIINLLHVLGQATLGNTFVKGSHFYNFYHGESGQQIVGAFNQQISLLDTLYYKL
jgi:hypothetical protein